MSSDESDRHGDAEDRVEVLLSELLEQTTDPDDAAVESLCRRHADLAGILRARLEFLRRVKPRAAERTPAVPSGETSFGPYELGAVLGGGGMGVVYRARERSTSREVALKLIRPEHAWFESARSRFRREIEAVLALQHPGIVTVYAVGEESGVPYIAMECIEGRSLAELILEHRSAPPPHGETTGFGTTAHRSHVDACCEIAAQVAAALAHAHTRGIVHRDVKPSNVMLTSDGRAHLIDFGLAHVAGAESMTRTGIQPGSLAYMSPEQVRGEEIDARTDVWSLGAVLYEMLTSCSPFLGTTEADTRRAIEAAAPMPARRRNPRVSRDLAAILETTLAPEPSRRYASMAALEQDLRSALERRPVAARKTHSLLRARRWIARHPGSAALLALGFVLFCVIPMLLLYQESSSRAAIEAEAARARRAEHASGIEADTASRSLEFLTELFYEADPSQSAGERVLARDILERGARRIRGQLEEEPLVRSRLLRAMGEAFAGLGLSAAGRELLTEAEALIASRLAADDPRLLEVRHSLARALANARELVQCTELVRRTLEALVEPSAAAEPWVGILTIDLANALQLASESSEAERHYQVGLAVLRRLLPSDDARLASAEAQYAWFRHSRDGDAEALELLQAALRHLGRNRPAGQPDQVLLLTRLAHISSRHGDLQSAVAFARRAVAMSETLYEPAHPMLAYAREHLALNLVEIGEEEEAWQHFDRARSALERQAQDPSIALARSFTHESTVAFATGDRPRAEAAARRALATWDRLDEGESLDATMALENLLCVLAAESRYEEALEPARRMLRARDAVQDADPQRIARSMGLCSYVLQRGGDAAKAAEAADAGLAALASLAVADCDDPRIWYLGDALRGMKRWRDAEGVWTALIRGKEHHARLATDAGALAVSRLAWAQVNSGRPTDAEASFSRAVELQEHLAEPDPDVFVGNLEMLGFLRKKRGDFDAAESALGEALRLARTQTGLAAQRISVLANCADLERLRGRVPRAIEHHLESLRVQRERDPRDRDPARAEQTLVRALDLLDDAADLPRRDEVRKEIAEAARALLPSDHALLERIK